MKALGYALAAGLLAGAAGCSRHGPAYDGQATYSYLEAVGNVRMNANADNRTRIPALIRGQDLIMLGGERGRMEQDKQDLAKIPAEKVDPDAIQFAHNFRDILDAYEAVCADSAELFREAKSADDAGASPPLMPAIRQALLKPEADSLGAVGALMTVGERLSAEIPAGAVYIAPIVQKLHADRDRLSAAKTAHHEFALKVKSSFAERYPTVRWSEKDVLPP
jgi:hypothetical protein